MSCTNISETLAWFVNKNWVWIPCRACLHMYTLNIKIWDLSKKSIPLYNGLNMHISFGFISMFRPVGNFLQGKLSMKIPRLNNKIIRIIITHKMEQWKGSQWKKGEHIYKLTIFKWYLTVGCLTVWWRWSFQQPHCSTFCIQIFRWFILFCVKLISSVDA